jgi:Predicted secreted protein
MATAINGKDLLVFIGSNAVGASRSCSLSMSNSLISTSSKDDGGWESVIDGKKNWSVSTEGLYAYDDANGIATAETNFIAGTSVTLNWREATQASF